MVSIELAREHGYVIAVALAFWIQQAVIFVIPVVMQRSKTGIKAPTLYPTDKEITNLKLSPSAVDQYMRTQRVHQNNVEFLSIFFPIFLIAGAAYPLHAACAGAAVWLGRMVTALGYWSSSAARSYGGWFHIPELYIVYLVGHFAYTLLV